MLYAFPSKHGQVNLQKTLFGLLHYQTTASNSVFQTIPVFLRIDIYSRCSLILLSEFFPLGPYSVTFLPFPDLVCITIHASVYYKNSCPYQLSLLSIYKTMASVAISYIHVHNAICFVMTVHSRSLVKLP